MGSSLNPTKLFRGLMSAREDRLPHDRRATNHSQLSDGNGVPPNGQRRGLKKEKIFSRFTNALGSDRLTGVRRASHLSRQSSLVGCPFSDSLAGRAGVFALGRRSFRTTDH
jgi:hypothetical protein